MPNVDFAAYQFTLEEACELSGVSPVTLRSWLKRGSASVGKKHPKLHRLFFSGVDIIRLRVMNDVIATCGAKPSVVQGVSDAVVARFWETSLRNPLTGRLVESEIGFRHDTQIVVSLAGGEQQITEHIWDGERYRPDPDIHRGPHIVIPADAIIADVHAAIVEHEARTYAPKQNLPRTQSYGADI